MRVKESARAAAAVLADIERMKRQAEADNEIAELFASTGIDLSELPWVMTAAELAPPLRTSEGALAQDRLRRRGIPYVKFGARVRYLRVDVARYLIANRKEAGS